MAKREVDYREDAKMVVSNNYIRAVHPDRMNINAMKLFRLAVTQCKMTDQGFYEYRFTISDLSKVLDVDRSDIYRDVQEMCKNIMQTVLYVGDGNPRHRWKYRHIFDKCDYSPEDEAVTIQLHPEMTDLFLQLRRDFTEIPISVLLEMKSKYALRLFEVICEKMMNYYPYAGNSTKISVTIDEIRNATGTTKKKTYDQISHLKSKILFPALEDIEKCAGWKIETEDIKQGRRITGFTLQVWSVNGFAYLEQCKRKGKIPEGNTPTVRKGKGAREDT